MLTEILKKLSNTNFANSPGSSTGRLLFDVQTWLREERRVCVGVQPIDSWDSWKYTILMEDSMCPFFEPKYDRFNEFDSYEKALEAGLHCALQIS